MSRSNPTSITRRTILTSGLTAAALGVAGPALASGGGPGGPAARKPGTGGEHGWVTSRLARMSLEQKAGQLFVQNVYGTDATTPDERNVPLYGVASPAEVVRKYHLGGVIYFAWTDNVGSPSRSWRSRTGCSTPRSPTATAGRRSRSRCRSRSTRRVVSSPASGRPPPSSRVRWRSVPAAAPTTP